MKWGPWRAYTLIGLVLDRLKALASCQPVQANFVPIFAEMLLDRKTPEISEG
jgi:hypothetical protein